MFKATINADTFRDSIEAISALVNECRMHIDDQGIRVLTVDTSNVALISLELDTSAFSSFNVDEQLELGIDIEKIRSMLTMIKHGNQACVVMEYDAENRKIKLGFDGYEYSVSLIDAKTIRKDPTLPSLDLPASFEVAGATFSDAIKAAGLIADKMALSIDTNRHVFCLNADGDADQIKREMMEPEVMFDKIADVRSLFSLDYLKDMGRIASRSERINIQLGNDHPVFISFGYANEHGKISYLLAPRIEAV